jgi:hypothetical protein
MRVRVIRGIVTVAPAPVPGSGIGNLRENMRGRIARNRERCFG